MKAKNCTVWFSSRLVILLLCLMALSAYIKLYGTHRDANGELEGVIIYLQIELSEIFFIWDTHPLTYINKQFKTLETFRLETMDIFDEEGCGLVGEGCRYFLLVIQGFHFSLLIHTCIYTYRKKDFWSILELMWENGKVFPFQPSHLSSFYRK